MCHVRTTHFTTCRCRRSTRIVIPCPFAFSSLGNFSCCGLGNETIVVGSLSSESEKEDEKEQEAAEEKEVVEPYCRRCMERMEQAVKEEYESLRARVREEGLRMKWPGLELVRALDALGRAEEEERRTLRDQCGL